MAGPGPIITGHASKIGTVTIRGEVHSFIQVVLLGYTCVGKSWLTQRYIEGRTYDFGATIGANYETKMVLLDHDKELKLAVWDTSGFESFDSSSLRCCTEAHAVIVVYDITDESTFEKAKTWVTRLQEQEASPNIFIALTGNKADIVSRRKVKFEDAQSYADDNNLDLFMEVSAKTGENVENLFLTIVYNLWMADISAAELRKTIHQDNKALVLAKRKLLRVPDTVTELTEVKILDLSHNNLTELPTSANKLTNLTTLILSHNRLAQLPEICVELINLICLYVDNNQLSSLPTSMKQLKKLQELDLSNNKLERLCIDINDLKHLEKLYVEGNPVIEVIRSVMERRAKNPGRINILDIAAVVPEEILAQGHVAKQLYERALRDGSVNVYRGRILLIGQDRAGKTSLKKSLLGLPFDPFEESTEGIEVDPSKCEIEFAQVKNWSSTGENKPSLSKDISRMLAEKQYHWILSEAKKHAEALKSQEISKVESMTKLEAIDKLSSQVSDVKKPHVYDVKNTDVSDAKNTDVYDVKNTDVSDAKNTDVYDVKNTDVSDVKNTDVYDVKNTDVSDVKNTDVSDVKNTAVSDVKNTAVSDVKNTDVSDVKNTAVSDVKNTDVSDVKNTDVYDVKNTDVSDVKNTDVSSPTSRIQVPIDANNTPDCDTDDGSVSASEESQLMIDGTSPPDDVTKQAIQLLKYMFLESLDAENADNKKESEVTVDFWDFAGQHQYYASHPVFLSSRAVYILVHNLSKPLDDPAEPCVRQGTHDVILDNPNNETNLENLLSWLVTVHSMKPTGEGMVDNSERKLPYLRPPVFIVGTHADQPFEDAKAMTSTIQQGISGKEYEKHVIRPFFSIDNTRSNPSMLHGNTHGNPSMLDMIKELSGNHPKRSHQAGQGDDTSGDGIHALRTKIMEVLRHEPYMGETIPVRWFNFEKVVEALVARNIYHMNLEELQTYAKEVCFIEDEDQFHLMLNFYHDLGMIVKHRSTVILEAQWLIDLFNMLITIPRFDKVDPIHSKYCQEVEKSGVLSMELVDLVFSRFIQQGIIKEDILDMMERFGLIAKFSLSPTDVKYFVPAQLKSSPEDLCKMEPSPTDPCPLYLHFVVDDFVPHGLFSRLVSRSTSWCSDIGSTQPPNLYQNGAWFVIGRQIIHDMILICKKRFIKILLRQRSQDEAVSVSTTAEVAQSVRLFMEGTLQDLSQEPPYLSGLQYKFCVACPYCLQESHKCANHSQPSCVHEDCLHLIEMKRGERLICMKNVCDKVLPVRGLEKWFAQRTSQDFPLCTSVRGLEKWFSQTTNQNLIKTGKRPGAILRPKANQAASKSEEEEEEEIVVESEEEIIEVGSEEEMEIASELENEIGAEDSENRRTVTSEGTHWDLKQGAVHLTFPRDAVSEPTSIVVHRWKSSACSPQLQEHEAVVSNVIEISTDSQEPLKFSVGVKLVLSHSAPNLHGYELVFFRLTDKDSNEWEEIAGTKVFRSLSDIQDEYPSANDIPDFYFPVVQAEIIECSTYAVVSRLKSSPPYTITPDGGSFNLPDYPSVSVTIPKKAVAPKAKIPLQIKVQEVPGKEFDGKDILVGPILRISCTEVVEFLKPVTIQLPVSLGDKQHEIPDLSACRVRVLFLRSDGEQKEWVEITDDLKNPATFDGKTVTFQVERFSGYMCLLDWCRTYFNVSGGIGYLSSLIWTQPQLAVFFAYFPAKERPDSQDILHLVCCPSHIGKLIVADIKQDNIKSLSESDSKVEMIPGQDKAYVSLSGGIRAVDEDDMDNFYLRFERNKRHLQQVPVRVISDKGLSAVEFYNSPKHDKDHLLCRLYFTSLSPLKRGFKDLSPCTSTVVGTSQGSPAQGNLGTPVIKQGTPANDELEGLGEDLGIRWKKVGRRLDFEESQLEGIDDKYKLLAEKGYQMLLRWKEREGADATYQVLNDALKHEYVQRQNLAEKYCQLIKHCLHSRKGAYKGRGARDKIKRSRKF